MASLAARPDGDTLSFTRLQDMIGLTPGNLIIHLRKLEEAGYVSSANTKNGSAPKTTVTLTRQGRTALAAHTHFGACSAISECVSGRRHCDTARL